MLKRILLVLLLAAAAVPAQTVNCIVAVVDGEIITLLDVQIAVEFGLGRDAPGGAASDPRLAALDALIDRKVVLNLAREAREVRGIDREELDAALGDIRRRTGEAAFAEKLRKFGLTEKDIEPYLLERMRYARALELRFSPTIPVSVTEVERYYRDTYVPEQARNGLKAEPIESVSGRIESRLRAERRTKQMVDWVRDLRGRANVQIRKDCLK